MPAARAMPPDTQPPVTARRAPPAEPGGSARIVRYASPAPHDTPGSDVTPIDFLKLLLDPSRLTVVGLVALEPHDLDELADRTRLRRKDVVAALAPLVDAGLVARDDGRYRLVPEALRELAKDLPHAEPPAEVVFFGMTQEEGAVLARFFRGRQLTEIPAQRSKRRIVLERLALDFEPGRHYTEPEVNELLSRYHPDYASLRRYLVDEGFLDRAKGEYWRAGGRVDHQGEGEA